MSWDFADIFGTRKLDSLGYHVALLIWLDVFVQLRLVTDGHTMTALYRASIGRAVKIIILFKFDGCAT